MFGRPESTCTSRSKRPLATGMRHSFFLNYPVNAFSSERFIYSFVSISTSMANAVRLVSVKPIQTVRNSQYFPSDSVGFSSSCVSSRFVSNVLICLKKKSCGIEGWSTRALDSSSSSSYSPVSLELEPILNETQFDRVIAEAQQLEESVVILWMASWCRKCIYLKPKLEKLAADYHPRIRFYCVDVNSVPHKLVVRAGVTKMPTIQLWKDGEKQAEVIGGHKAYLVVNEVREMLENEDPL